MASPAVEDSIADARGQCGQLAWPIATGAEQLDLALEVSLICLEKVIYMEKEASSLRRYNAEGRLLLDPGDLDGPPKKSVYQSHRAQLFQHRASGRAELSKSGAPGATRQKLSTEATPDAYAENRSAARAGRLLLVGWGSGPIPQPSKAASPSSSRNRLVS
jgi:hypothetical protein